MLVTLSRLSVPPAATGADNEAEAISPEATKVRPRYRLQDQRRGGPQRNQDVCEDRAGSKFRIGTLEKGCRANRLAVAQLTFILRGFAFFRLRQHQRATSTSSALIASCSILLKAGLRA